MTDIEEKEKIHFDALKAYFREDYCLGGQIVVRVPTIGDILEFGESVFYSFLMVFIGNPTTFRLQLWDIGIDWNKISDFELFMRLAPSVPFAFSQCVFKDIHFDFFEKTQRLKEGKTEIVLYNKKQDIVIDEKIYLHLRSYLQFLFGIKPKIEKAADATTKDWIIQEEREQYERNKKDYTYDSFLLPLVSACVNHPGFKYKTTELKEVGIFEFMDSVNRLQVYESSIAMLRGSYSGFVDMSKVDHEMFNFMRKI